MTEQDEYSADLKKVERCHRKHDFAQTSAEMDYWWNEIQKIAAKWRQTND